MPSKSRTKPRLREIETPEVGVPVWAEPKPEAKRPALTNDRTADVVIVGAGYTGLWTAYYLLKEDPTLDVVILEREYAGFGASGRNGGWCSAIFPISLGHLAKLHNHQAAMDLQHAMNDTVDEVGRVVAEEAIDCDYSKEGFLSLARSSAQLQRAKTTIAGARDFGLPSQWNLRTQEEARSMIGAEGTLGAAYTPHCALVHPGKLVRGLAETVERMGATIHENTAATHIAPGQVDTERGRVNAKFVVRATEGYTSELPGQERTLVPLYSLVLATEPLPETVRNELQLNHRFGFNDLRNLRIYAQMTKDGRMVFGGRGAPYHFGSAVQAGYDVNNAIHAKIHRTMIDFFPMLKDAAITHRWGGPLGVPRDWHPSVGLESSTGLAWAGPYVGDGVATSNLAARILRNLILGKMDRLNNLPIVDHRSPQWEPEPLRWLLVNMGLVAASAGDLEERITNKPSNISKLLEKITGAH
ncbi:NAD(P)/FAD-dependent oxidoreductase [Paeniglutamicibacter cryotolerans]|uniref:Glycine/D-amino acid oxidase-like deaminating enzyme n=1 Tax=Paeniglutamicibacter cryotolerans TaxID=670079 RepID=A0A839QGJ2_9MICC|nr:FAD-dependent oxidoreductase [Paeniglutamicibacter cryotolerans]MBB2994733.1 glycine/D-amino acid oxidase-like deaminating enzyme [Paeniglutamicibacter cryotolerans]